MNGLLRKSFYKMNLKFIFLMFTLVVIRGLLFSSILYYILKLKWGREPGQDFLPINLVYYLGDYFLNKKLLKTNKYEKTISMRHLLLNINELKYLAVPPKLGGPINQNVYIFFCCTMLVSMILLLIPITLFQFISFIVVLSGTFAYCLFLLTYYGRGIFEFPYPVYLTICYCTFGFATILIMNVYNLTGDSNDERTTTKVKNE